MFGLNGDDHKDNEDNDTKIDISTAGGDDNSSSSDKSIVSGPPPTTDSSDTTSSDMPSLDENKGSSDTMAGNDDLLELKKEALQKLSPLVGHLDQTPEEKFRTTMMMVQATDDQSLVKAAYEAANNIPDEKAKAQALLDVVNEINYFTQPKKD